ncbi:MAG: hypothetical protein AB7S93_10030 [Xanthobacteraceae bacterium]
MADGDIYAIPIGKWSTAYHHPTKSTFIHFEWLDRPAMTFAIPPEQAVEFAKAILENYETPPPARDQMS